MFNKLKENLAARFQAGWRHATFDDETAPETGEGSLADTTPLRTDSGQASRIGIIALVVGFGGFISWAALAPLDEGVPAPGVVNVESKPKAIQHLRGGIIQEIRVREGDEVKAGDTLVTLNNTDLQAQLDIVLSMYWSGLAQEARLQAEQARRAQIGFPAALTGSPDPRARDAINVQTSLFNTRRDALRSQISILEENLKGLQEQIKGLEALQSGKQRQIQLLEEELQSMRELAREGFFPKVRLMEIERLLAEISSNRAGDLANISRVQSSIAEIQLRIVATTQGFQKELQQQLSEIQKEVGNHNERLTALREELARSELRAPVDGTVVGLKVFTIGGVVQPGQTIMEIVPQGEAMLIEVQIPTNLIEKVHPGLQANIRFATVKGGQMPPIAGELVTVSADRLIEQHTGKPYYLGRVQVTPKGIQELARSQHTIHPGMPADVVITTGERTLLDYLINPLKSRISGALKEM